MDKKYKFEKWGVILMGPAGSGKTFVRNRDYIGLRVLSFDIIRFMILDYDNTGRDFDPTIENEVREKLFNQFDETLRKLDSFILDATCLTRDLRSRFIIQAVKKGYKIKIVWFHPDPVKVLMRNRNRKRKVPDDVIIRQFAQMQKPEAWEYDELEEIT